MKENKKIPMYSSFTEQGHTAGLFITFVPLYSFSSCWKALVEWIIYISSKDLPAVYAADHSILYEVKIYSLLEVLHLSDWSRAVIKSSGKNGRCQCNWMRLASILRSVAIKKQGAHQSRHQRALPALGLPRRMNCMCAHHTHTHTQTER